jgi:anti-anti-sigma regulatory factor
LKYATGSYHGSVLVIEVLVPQLRKPETAYALRDEILELADPAKTSHVVVDLQRVTYIGSVGQLAFLALRRHVDGTPIVFCNISPTVRELLEVCHLVAKPPATAPFAAEETRQAALARCSLD